MSNQDLNEIDRKLKGMPKPALNSQRKQEIYHSLEEFSLGRSKNNRTAHITKEVFVKLAGASALALVFVLSVIFTNNDNDESISINLPDSQQGEENTRKPNPTFIVNGQTLYGVKGKLGIRKVNGEQHEPEFIGGPQGRHYEVYFWGKKDELNGKRYKMTGTHAETGGKVKLYETEISASGNSVIKADAHSAAKFSLDKPGLWKIDVTVDDKEFASFQVDARKPLTIPNEYDHAKEMLHSINKYGINIQGIHNSNYMAFFHTKPNFSMILKTDTGFISLIHLENKTGKTYKIIRKDGAEDRYLYQIIQNGKKKQLLDSNANIFFNINDEYISMTRDKKLHEKVKAIFQLE
ncbi:hypothetical protein [Peribacillus glennii]|uniref:Uncharacterized protein n=1 Tax=Peribacillus glennii TaxID=2303991 RepID=A0A372LAN9_9BACI|nr:hypothetical protein [Peribacillus glennii]RFU62816.1 hypothetical protein D0466_12710 [Peribacillus glennii]